jgi:hypothetical protein
MTTILSKQDTVKLFTEAIKLRNALLIEPLLSIDGTFETQDENLNNVQSNKSTFISWLSIL